MPLEILRFRPGVVLPRRAYLDTNLFLHARDQESRTYRSAHASLQALTTQNVELNVSTLVFDELWWAQFKASYRLLTGQELTGREYKHHIDVWRDNWPAMRRITSELLAWERLKFVDAASRKDLVRAAATLIDENPLAPRDAFHLAVVLRHDIPSLVTADKDFTGVRIPDGQNLTIVRF